jgi:hypothetical protein
LADKLPTKALSLKPEWEQLVYNEEKLIENRSWRIKPENLPITIAIHRSGKSGAIRCIADVAEILTVPQAKKRFHSQAKHIFGPYCFVLSNIRRLDTPVYCRGQLRLWNLGESLLSEIKENLNGEESI